ncbi:hypothetical protein GTO89_14925 [Heliobacterium gestii]|uniref:SLH domain-containing protein n=1 Tax=Heliomicrobium gestii TaxID=2699 RepID=A0A845LN63_HELGE|nr:S-layer homology domain-containing protein [Heliomicrobium gestii]MBM7868148.1 hypothetical protein [Heliomicrobium gestii]MZP44326.1 hypothetical protein [Heliomicrobium gestii]
MNDKAAPRVGALLLAGAVFLSGAAAPVTVNTLSGQASLQQGSRSPAGASLFAPQPAWADTGSTGPADARGHWAEAQITEMVDRGWIRGDEQGLFHPEQTMSRAEFVSLLVRAFDFRVNFIKAPDIRDVATDVPGDVWYAGDLITAAHTFLSLPDKAFHPQEGLTREVMAQWVWAAYLHKTGDDANDPAASGSTPSSDAASTPSAIPFSDNDAIGPDCRESVAAASAAGFIKGDEEGYFKPKAVVTRAQAAVIVHRVAGKLTPYGASIAHTPYGRSDYGKWNAPRQAVLIRSEAESRAFAEQWRDTTLDMPVLSTTGLDFGKQALVALIGFSSSSSNPPQVTAMIRQGNTLTVYLEKKTGRIETADITGAYRFYSVAKCDVEGVDQVRAELRLVPVHE